MSKRRRNVLWLEDERSVLRPGLGCGRKLALQEWGLGFGPQHQIDWVWWLKPRTWQVEGGRSEIQDHPGYIRSCHKIKHKTMKTILGIASRDYLWGWPVGKFTSRCMLELTLRKKACLWDNYGEPGGTSSCQHMDGICP